MSENLVDKYWSDEARQYSLKENKWYLYYEFNQRNYIAYNAILKLKKEKKGCIVDFGCGNGYTLSKVSHLFEKCYGVDIAKQMANIATKRLPNCKILNIPIEKFNKKVDVVIALGVMEYMDDEETMEMPQEMPVDNRGEIPYFTSGSVDPGI